MTASGQASSLAPVRVCLLGSFRVLAQGVPLPMRPGGKVEQLIGGLALSARTGASREELLWMVWPDCDAALAGQSLNSLVYSLRKRLGDALGHRPPIVERDGRYRLNLEEGVGIDVLEFDAAVARADVSARAGDSTSAIDSYRAALDLYAGDLVIGLAVAHLVERERLRAQFLGACARLADHHFEIGQYDRALENALRLLAHDPCREDAHRMAMRCYVRLGVRAQAVRQYRVCQRILADEFDAPPEEATDRLFELVRLQPGRV
jgi:DNA-binding SARP family transcriptional activator